MWTSNVTIKTNIFLDITEDVCPMTFVKTRLMIERMSPGDIAEILLKGAEPLQNVPESVAELGHEVLSMEPADGPPGASPGETVHRLIVRKSK